MNFCENLLGSTRITPIPGGWRHRDAGVGMRTVARRPVRSRQAVSRLAVLTLAPETAAAAARAEAPPPPGAASIPGLGPAAFDITAQSITGAVYGGYQKIFGTALSRYPNDRVRLMRGRH
jgi:hypothetical protein